MAMNYSCLTRWNGTYISSFSFHNLTIPCYVESGSSSNFEHALDSPTTFFVQLLRFTLAITFTIIILALYNSIEVLGRTVFSVASCSLHWILFLFLVMFKCVILMIFVPVISNVTVGKNSNDTDDENITHIINLQLNLNLAGFVTITLIQIAATTVLFCALDHEFRFRSAEFASVDSPFSRRCASLTKWRLFISWPRGIALTVSALTTLLLVAIEICAVFYPKNLGCDKCRDNCSIDLKSNKLVPASLVWVWLSFVVVLRVGVVIIGVCLLFIRHETLRLTIAAKIYLILSLLLSLAEDIPNSVLTQAPHEKHNDCIGHIFTVYDLFQLLGAFSLVTLLFFVRSQYLRVEQESKLSVVWDMQKLLQVNGRKDIRAY